MVYIIKKCSDRLSKALPIFQKVLSGARDRDINESDTVTIVTDMLADLFGYDKYTEVTSEQAIRGTYCDLAISIDDKIQYLIEVKAIGLKLNDNHLRQAVNYGAHHGIPWIVLTNGIHWEIYKIQFEQPISWDQTCSINMLELSSRRNADLEQLYLLSKEGHERSAIEEYHSYAQVVNRFAISAAIQSEPVLGAIRCELRRLGNTSKVKMAEIADLLPDVLKRDVMEGSDAEEARKRMAKAQAKSKAKRAKKAEAKKPEDD